MCQGLILLFDSTSCRQTHCIKSARNQAASFPVNGTAVMKENKTNSSLAANLGLSIVVLFIMVCLCEMVVRILYKDTTVMFPRYHTDAVYGDYTLRTIRPNSHFFHSSIGGRWEFITNGQGFRNYEDFEYTKNEAVLRVVAIGDSHTQGYEVHQDHTFSSTVERYLNRKGIKSEVINAGVSGFSNAEALLLLENELVNYHPDYVILGFYANDFQDNLKAGLFKLDEDNNLVKTEKTTHIPGVKIQNIIYSIPGIQWLSENSYFYSVLFNNAWSFAKQRLTKKSIDEAMDIAVNTKENFTDYEKTLAARLLQRIYAVSKEHGAKLIIVDIPSIGEGGKELPSIDEHFYESIRDHNDFFQSSNILQPYRGLGLIHQPHGHHHITRFTHTLFGVGVGAYIENDRQSRNVN